MDGNVLVYLNTSKRKILINFQKIDWTEWELVLTKRKHLQKANRNKNLIEHIRAVHRRNHRRRRRLVRRDLHRHRRRHQHRRRNLRLDHLRDLVHRTNLRRRQNEILNTINNENDRDHDHHRRFLINNISIRIVRRNRRDHDQEVRRRLLSLLRIHHTMLDQACLVLVHLILSNNRS